VRFNWPLPDHFRIVYLPKIEELKIACDRLGDFWKGIGRPNEEETIRDSGKYSCIHC